MFGLLISYLLERMISVTDMGEQQGDFDNIPNKNTKGKVQTVKPWPRRL